MLNRFSEIRLARFHHAVLLAGVLLLGIGSGAYANDIEDASKLFKQGQHSQALDKVNGYLASNPKDAQARFLKGLIITEQGKTADAIKIFSALTEDYPDLPEPYNNLAVLYASQGQYDKAKQLLERAISTHPSYSTAHENLGDIYAKMASQAYDRALQLDHSNAATQTKLAMIQNLFAGNPRNQETAANNAAAPINVAPGKACPEPCQGNEEAAQDIHAGIAGDSPQLAPPNKTESVPLPPERADQKEGNKEIWGTVQAWAAAWSAKKTDKYLSFYAADFKTPGGETRAAWEKARRERIGKPKHIHVDVHAMAIQFIDSGHATVKFRQFYSASHLKTSSNKTLLMVKSGGKWLIQEEHS